MEAGQTTSKAAAPFGPKLAENQTGFDGFAQADLVGQNHALAKGGFQGKQRGVNLVRIQVNGGVEQRCGEAVNVCRWAFAASVRARNSGHDKQLFPDDSSGA